MTPLNDIVIVELDSEKTAGGIELLDSYKDPAGTVTGVVKAVNANYINSAGVKLSTMHVRHGDRVLFARKHGIVIKGKDRMACVHFENLLAVMEE